MLTACALTALLALAPPPQGPATAPSVIDRVSSVATAIFGKNEDSRFYLKMGGITQGAGLSLGPGVQFKGVAGSRLDAYGLLAISHRKYLLAEFSLVAPRLAVPGLQAGVFGRRRFFPQEDFFGIGASSSKDDRVSYTYDENAAGAFVSFKPRFSGGPEGALTLDARLEYRHPDVGHGHDSSWPSIEQRFHPVEAPGMVLQPDFLVAALSADVSLATPVARPASGGRYIVSLARFADRGSALYSFNLIEADLRQYVPLVPEQHLIVLRAVGSFTTTSGANEVPFYYMPNLGGGSSLRGYRYLRFRDRQRVLLQGEYRWAIRRFLEVAAFYDAGAVAPEVSGLAARDLMTDYGIGLRVGSSNRVFGRLDVAFGGHEGTRVFFKFSDVF